MTLPTTENPLRIGTRGSPLALAQAEETRDRLMAAHGLGAEAFEIQVPFNANEPGESDFDITTVNAMVKGVEDLVQAKV